MKAFVITRYKGPLREAAVAACWDRVAAGYHVGRARPTRAPG